MRPDVPSRRHVRAAAGARASGARKKWGGVRVLADFVRRSLLEEGEAAATLGSPHSAFRAHPGAQIEEREGLQSGWRATAPGCRWPRDGCAMTRSALSTVAWRQMMSGRCLPITNTGRTT